MPQVKVNFGPKVGGAKKTFPPEKKAPGGLGSKGKVNPFLKNDAAKKQPAAAAAPAPEKPAPSKEVTVDIASKPEIKVELPAAPAPEPAAPVVEPEPEAPKPEKPKGSKSFYSVLHSSF